MFQIWHQFSSAVASIVMLPAALQPKSYIFTSRASSPPPIPPAKPNPRTTNGNSVPNSLSEKHAPDVTISVISSPVPAAADSLPSKMAGRHVPNGVAADPLTEFVADVRTRFEAPLARETLLALSANLQEQFAAKLQDGNALGMLPSFNHTLPTGHERGTYLALDVGGSNFRVALVELSGREIAQTDSPLATVAVMGKSRMRIVKQFGHKIGPETKALKGHAFFDWMAEKIEQAIVDDEIRKVHGPGTYAMGLAWSFPVQQTSSRTGNLLDMGKHFAAAQGVMGEDLGELLMKACRKRDLEVRMDALINDGSATLLSRAYCDPSTRFGLILGTGTNMSVILPCTAFAVCKFGSRPQEWHNRAQRVLVNTEFSTYGKGLLPMTRYDEYVNATHSRPDFQPIEYQIGGGYLGEITRLVLLEAVKDHGLFGGILDAKLEERYSLSTHVIAGIEVADTTSLPLLIRANLLDNTTAEIPASHFALAQSIISSVSARAAGILAAGIHAMWSLRSKLEGDVPDMTTPASIGCNGSVIELYPGFRSRCQSILDDMTGREGAVSLEIAWESALFGAAVAVSCLDNE